jgi:dihydroxyacetone kinase-like predicted kinase
LPDAQDEQELDIAVVVVSPGPGLSRVFESLGANLVVSGGQTMNPSIEQLLDAVQSAPAQQAVILPNNSNIILAAQQAQALSAKRVRVIPTKTIPQGISAMLAYNYSADLDTNARAMERSAGEVQTAEVTVAVRDVQIDGLEVKEGQLIGLVEGKLVATGSEFNSLVTALFEHMDMEEVEVLTFYYGEAMSEQQAQDLADTVGSAYPDLEIEILAGGQPHYHYIISAE